ncbi:MAG TPA: response regulator, partial [Spirochaetia bacterium]|nr:response regulator [Spirochaetia bacterium]
YILDGFMESAGGGAADIVRIMVTHPIFTTHPRQFELLTDLVRRMEIDGLVYLGWMPRISAPEKARALFGPLNIPLMSLGKFQEGIPSVYQNGYKQIATLLDHACITHQLKKIVFVHPIWEDDRIEGFRDYMKKRNLYDPNYEITGKALGDANTANMIKRSQGVVRIIFDERNLDVEAIISLYSHEAACLMDRLLERGMHPPEDIILMCWEDVETSRYHDIPITALYYPFKELGFLACENMIKILRGEDVPAATEVPGRLMIRSSCGCRMHALNLVDAFPDQPHPPADGPSPETAAADDAGAGLSATETNTIKNALLEAISARSDKAFVSVIKRMLYRLRLDVLGVHSFQEAVLTLRNDLYARFQKDTTASTVSEALWFKVMLLIQGKLEQIFGKQEVTTFEQSWNIVNMSQFIITSFKIDLILDSLSAFLKELHINCWLYLLKPGWKNWDDLELKYAFREGTVLNVGPEETSFDHFQKLLFWKQPQQLIFTHLLHIRDELIGAIFFEAGPLIERIYEDISIQLSSSIKSAVVLENLEIANQKLAELDNLKNDFIANITHDFRSPLMIILNNTDLGLKYDASQDPQIIRKRYQVILEASLKLKHTIDRLLDVAKMDNQGIKIHICEIPLTVWLENIVEFYKTATSNSGITIGFQLPSTDINDFFSDPEKLEEILNNVISNAFKFIDPEKGEIRIELQDSPSTIRIVVADNGIGIPKEKLETIFQRFEQVSNDKRISYKGTGIGLAFSRQLTHYLKGRIWAESDGPDRGSRFILELPKGKSHWRREDMDEPVYFGGAGQDKRRDFTRMIQAELNRDELCETAVMITKPNKENEFDHLKALILIVEDNARIRDIEVEYLRKAGYHNFILTADGGQAIEAAFAHHPDIVLCDFHLPTMN